MKRHRNTEKHCEKENRSIVCTCKFTPFYVITDVLIWHLYVLHDPFLWICKTRWSELIFEQPFIAMVLVANELCSIQSTIQTTLESTAVFCMVVHDLGWIPPQAPEFDRWSGNSQGQSESLRLGRSLSGRGSRHLQFPRREDNPLSPGYTEPLCVSVHIYTVQYCILRIECLHYQVCANCPVQS